MRNRLQLNFKYIVSMDEVLKPWRRESLFTTQDISIYRHGTKCKMNFRCCAEKLFRLNVDVSHRAWSWMFNVKWQQFSSFDFLSEENSILFLAALKLYFSNKRESLPNRLSTLKIKLYITSTFSWSNILLIIYASPCLATLTANRQHNTKRPQQ